MTDDGVYTVWGASYSLRHRALKDKLTASAIGIRGVIGKTNLAVAPPCAVHATGIADPEGCTAPIPVFWLCDEADAAPEDCIEVMGWASNYANIFSAQKAYAGSRSATWMDEYWGITLPNPIPAEGARVTVTGRYGTSFTLATSGAATDPTMGILTYQSMTYETLPPTPAQLPRKP